MGVLMIRNKRNRNTQCPICLEEFFSRKLRHHHTVVKHRHVRIVGTKRTLMKNRRRRLKVETVLLSEEQLLTEVGYAP